MRGTPTIAGGRLGARRLIEGIAWRTRPLRHRWFFLRSFRNGPTLMAGYRRKEPRDRAVCWDGTVIHHPPGRLGLPETILEIWYDEIYTKSFYQPSPNDVVIDAGANVGLFCVWLARRFPSCRIYAFEPFRENFEALTRNIRSAGVASVHPIPAALGGITGSGIMGAGGPRSLDHCLISSGTGHDERGRTRVLSFGDALRTVGADRIALFKLDIEGGEYDLFEHATVEELRKVDRFAIEYHEHMRPGVLSLLRSRLAVYHRVRVVPAPCGRYGMLYATSGGAGPPGPV